MVRPFEQVKVGSLTQACIKYYTRFAFVGTSLPGRIFVYTKRLFISLFMSFTFSNMAAHRRAILIQFSAWFGYVVIYSCVMFLSNTSYYGIVQLPFTLGLLAVVFYTNVYLLVIPNVERGTYVRLVLSTLLMLALYVLARYLLLIRLLPAIGIKSMYEVYNSYTDKQFLFDSLWLAFHYLSLSYGYYFALRLVRAEQQKREDERRILLLENTNRRAELAFLRTQLNPHFLFNTLNFFLSDALKTSPRLADAILNLSQMLRTITEVGQNEMVSAAQEITYVRHYLNIQRYRFSERLSVVFTVEGDELSQDFMLPPLILISLVENVFKYGDTVDPAKPAQINISINQDGLTYYSENSKKALPSYTQSGVGLSNIEQQLKLAFPGKASISTHEVEGIFRVNLSISITY